LAEVNPRYRHRLCGGSFGALKMQEWKTQEWKKQESIARVENAGVENTGAKTYVKPSEQKIKFASIDN